MTRIKVTSTGYHVTVEMPNGAAYTMSKKQIIGAKDINAYNQASIFLSGEGMSEIDTETLKEIYEGALNDT
jgi:hypothetical protein